MYPVIPVELTQTAVQLVVYFVTVVGILLSLVTGGSGVRRDVIANRGLQIRDFKCRICNPPFTIRIS